MPAGNVSSAGWTVASYHRAAGLSTITSITAYRNPGSTTIDGLSISYSNGDFDLVGSPDAVNMGARVANLTISVADRVKELYMWVNQTTSSISGVYITMLSGAQLSGSQGNTFTKASLSLVAASGALGSGLLLGVTAGVNPATTALSALSFTFLSSPTSSGIAVDMAAIDINSLQYVPAFNSKSSVSSTGGSSQVKLAVLLHTHTHASSTGDGGAMLHASTAAPFPAAELQTHSCKGHHHFVLQATCSDFSATVRLKAAYTKAAAASRLKQLMDALGESDNSQLFTLGASLQYAGVQELPASATKRNDLWTGQVYDLFGESGSLTAETGISQTISAPKVTFTLPAGQQVGHILQLASLDFCPLASGWQNDGCIQARD
jgi:hypothetical protein